MWYFSNRTFLSPRQILIRLCRSKKCSISRNSETNNSAPLQVEDSVNRKLHKKMAVSKINNDHNLNTANCSANSKLKNCDSWHLVGKQQQARQIHFRIHFAKLHDNQNDRSRPQGVSLVQSENQGQFDVPVYIAGMFNATFFQVKVMQTHFT